MQMCHPLHYAHAGQHISWSLMFRGKCWKKKRLRKVSFNSIFNVSIHTIYYSTFANYTTYDITKMMIILNIATLRGCHMFYFLQHLSIRDHNVIIITYKKLQFQGEEIPYCLESMDFGTEIDGTQDFFQVEWWQLWFYVLSVLFSCL